MKNRMSPVTRKLARKLPRAVALGARVYVTLVIAQFLFGFVAGVVLVTFDYDLLSTVAGIVGASGQ